MRLKISTIIICFILAATLVVIAKLDGGGTKGRNNETIAESKETSAYKPLKPAVEPKQFVFSAVHVIEQEEEPIVIEIEEEIYSEPINDVIVEKETPALAFSEKEEDLLLRIGMCEAGGESVECVANVMCAVLNRVEDDYFPNSIYDVLYQSGQFTPVSSGWINTVQPSDKCYEALEMVKSGWDESQGALYFESCSGDSWHSRNLERLFICGNMKFYK